jgi:hypothetical protein
MVEHGDIKCVPSSLSHGNCCSASELVCNGLEEKMAKDSGEEKMLSESSAHRSMSKKL